MPHVAFEVDDLRDALDGHHVIIEPTSTSAGVMVAFIKVNGAPVELMQIDHELRPLISGGDSPTRVPSCRSEDLRVGATLLLARSCGGQRLVTACSARKNTGAGTSSIEDARNMRVDAWSACPIVAASRAIMITNRARARRLLS